MSKLADALREFGIYNDHELLRRFSDKASSIYISYYSPEPRSVRGPRACVYSPFFNTAPASSGYKVFSGVSKESIPKAMEWASKKYGIEEWAPSPFGSKAKVPLAVRKAAEKAVKEKFLPTHSNKGA